MTKLLKTMKPALKATLALPFVLALLALIFCFLVYYPIIPATIALLVLIWFIWDVLYRSFSNY